MTFYDQFLPGLRRHLQSIQSSFARSDDQQAVLDLLGRVAKHNLPPDQWQIAREELLFLLNDHPIPPPLLSKILTIRASQNSTPRNVLDPVRFSQSYHGINIPASTTASLTHGVNTHGVNAHEVSYTVVFKSSPINTQELSFQGFLVSIDTSKRIATAHLIRTHTSDTNETQQAICKRLVTTLNQLLPSRGAAWKAQCVERVGRKGVYHLFEQFEEIACGKTSKSLSKPPAPAQSVLRIVAVINKALTEHLQEQKGKRRRASDLSTEPQIVKKKRGAGTFGRAGDFTSVGASDRISGAFASDGLDQDMIDVGQDGGHEEFMADPDDTKPAQEVKDREEEFFSDDDMMMD